MNLFVFPIRGNPFCLPGLAHFGGFKPGHLAGDLLSIVRPHRDAPEITRTGLQSQWQAECQAVDIHAPAAVIQNMCKCSIRGYLHLCSSL